MSKDEYYEHTGNARSLLGRDVLDRNPGSDEAQQVAAEAQAWAILALAAAVRDLAEAHREKQ